jgi:tRNA 2-thiouridine synthesizing protein B
LTAVSAETLRDGGYQGENRDSPPDCKQKPLVFAPHLNQAAIPAVSTGIAGYLNMLHIINKSPFSTSLADCLRFVAATDAILLIEDAVYAGIKESECSNLLKPLLTQLPIYALIEDINARGIADKIIPGIKIIDYAGFVDLTIVHHPIQTWS